MLIPAIIAKDTAEIKEKISLVKGLVKWVHIDVMDGKFVPTTTFPYSRETKGNILSFKKMKTKLKIEAHLMVNDPEKEVDEWIEAGAKRILVHFESFGGRSDLQKIRALIDKCENNKVELGLVLNPETQVSDLSIFDDVLKSGLKFAQLMSVHPGWGGQKFINSTIGKIKKFSKKYPYIAVQIDGGVNLKNAEKILKTGVKNLVAGSAVFKSQDIKKIIKKFKAIINETKNQKN